MNNFGKDIKDLNILILNAPCNGFGDIIFAFKLYKIIKSIYNSNVYIATPDKEKMMMLGNLPDETVILLTKQDGTYPGQCRRFESLKMHTNLIFDLILPAPIPWDFKFSLRDIKKLIPYATKYNTYSFSEYNDYLNKGIFFNTGLGKGRLGMLFTKENKSNIKSNEKSNRLIKDKYALAYLNTIDSTTPRWRSCLKNFIQMITNKYKYRHFQLIVSPSMMDYLKGKPSKEWFIDASMTKNELRSIVHKYYKNIILIDSKENNHVLSDIPNYSFIIRGDILPVPNHVMLQYIKQSVKDILITGDQSITDVLTCCPEKNIWYQIAPWKENLGKELAKQMNNKYLKSKKTSCGTTKSKFKSNYKKFIKDNNFVKNFRPIMDDIMNQTANDDMPIQRRKSRQINIKLK